jgi:Enoyl-(Acyl carrier protein) reductase
VVAVVFDQPVEGSVRKGDNSPSVVSCATRFAREKASARAPLRRPELADGWLHDVKPPRSLPIPLPFHNRSYVRTWTAEFARRGIRANVISPGPIETAILESFRLKKPLMHSGSSSRRTSHSVELVSQRKSLRLHCSSLQTKAVTSAALTWRWTAAWCRSEIPAGFL